MDTEGTAKLINAVAKLSGAIIWPALLSFILIRFGARIGDFILSVREFTFKGPGFEASAKRTEATAALVAATVSRPKAGGTPKSAAENATREAVQIVGEVSSRTISQIENSQALWVDDIPENNRYERQALEVLGVIFVISTSTDDAMDKVKMQKFDVIISDMARPPDPEAGYTLLEKLRSSGFQIPFIIYSVSRSPEHQAEARRRGAMGCTNRPTELFEMVLSVLRH